MSEPNRFANWKSVWKLTPFVEETYPSTRKVRNTLDADGDLAQVQSQKNAAAIWRNYENSFVYTAAGAVSSLRLGNGKFENTQFNSRLQPTQIGLGASANVQNVLKLNYDYGTAQNNGNVLSQMITVPIVGAMPRVSRTLWSVMKMPIPCCFR